MRKRRVSSKKRSSGGNNDNYAGKNKKRPPFNSPGFKLSTFTSSKSGKIYVLSRAPTSMEIPSFETELKKNGYVKWLNYVIQINNGLEYYILRI